MISHAPARILLMLREHMGDVLNASIAVRLIRKQFPKAHIVACGGEAIREVFWDKSLVDDLWVRPRRQGAWGKFQSVYAMWRGHFDTCIMLDDVRSHMIQPWIARVPYRYGVSRGKSEWAYTSSVKGERGDHEVHDELKRLLAHLGIDVSEYKPLFEPKPQAIDRVEKLVSEANFRDFVAFHPCCSMSIRNWPIERFIDLASALPPGMGCAVTGIEADRAYCQPLLDGQGIADFVGKLDLHELGALYARAKVVVCGDTGPMHLAAAVGTPIIALYGPSDPQRSGPLTERVTYVRFDQSVENGDLQAATDALLGYLKMPTPSG